jgi:hypothetical protein
VVTYFSEVKGELRAGDGAAARVGSAAFMKERLNTIIGRRDLLSFAVAGAGAAAASAVVPERTAAKSVDLKDKRKARYRASSTEVRDFYRVNSYPTR